VISRPGLAALLAPPRLSVRVLAVWRRNALVWRKLLAAALLGNLADPLIYLLGLGYGLGSLVGPVGGTPYIGFLAAGSLCSATMQSASFEAFYSAFSRMQVQQTWEAILNAPVSLEDIVAGELLWAGTKASFSGLAILLVAGLLGLVHGPQALWVVLLAPLIGLAFAALGLVVTACARGYDFFTYYFTLLVTPMLFISGVFFPAGQLPPVLRGLGLALPLSHAVALVRPLMLGTPPEHVLGHVAVLAGYTLAGFWIALALLRRRLLA
jgi:lipooligosaccharide transport system permease protein